ncbi:outer membrane lipase/esterase [Chromobacterium alkanivorans]|uniref:autotransporter outer membrane beta-barrel domain-containing protein n=1 Tax=Chromobacterium alkanivorans TaxID=1071719 RepID=UPI00216A9A0E|nr:autotransporter domain-containing protein [Chromobacterium alkanivorans]MCS3802571.1 outer membrane lipase/esterase [Chromobacterium alkanivorans]MCS3816897.1 outer membrane lipase/esterase [Chromobacterium alkanivorans]MCS3871937.1 outer membrane lipase/esterase [Chromobacterium alkanivorans]
MRKRLNTLAVATLLAMPAAASAYSNFYFFGDSLSDVGAFGGLGGLPANARWTTGNGANWTDALAARYGLKSIANNSSNPNASPSGNNYAQGGAVAQLYGDITVFPGTTGANGSVEQFGPDKTTAIQELPQQISAYLAASGGKANPNAVYSVWIGGNDIAAAGTITADPTQTSATKLLISSANSTSSLIGQLQSAGAQTIIVPNVPNLASTPAVIYQTVQGVATKVGMTNGLSGTALSNYVTQAVGAAWQVLSSNASTSGNQNAVIQQALAAANAAIGQPDSVTTLTASYNTAAAGLQTLSNGYNALVDNALLSSGRQHGVVRANISLLFQEVLADPARYGFTNALGSSCPQSAISCPANILPAQSYLFSDALHPTPAAHAMIAEYVYDLLQAPYFAGALPESALNNARQLGGALDSRYQAIRARKREVGAVSAFVSGAFNDDKVGYDALSAKPQGRLYTLGLDFQVSPALSLGLAMSRQNGKTDINGIATPGSVDDHSTLMSALFSYQQERFWLDGDAHIGSGDIDTRRQVSLGAARIALNGNARQSQYGMRVAGGYLMPLGAYRAGPIAGLDYAHVKVNGFTEQGGNSSSMAFNAQNGTSLVARVGWQLEADIGRFSPYAKLSYAHEFKRDDRVVTAGLATTSGDYSVKLGKPKADWLEWTAGLSAQLSKSVSMFGQLSAVSGRSGSSQTSGNVGMALTF